MSSSDSSVNSEEEDEHIFERDLPRGRANDPRVTELSAQGWYGIMQDMTAEDWEQLGHAISNNTYLKEISFTTGVFGPEVDYEKLSSFFRGLTGSDTVNTVILSTNHFGVQGVHDMTPFLQNTSSLTKLDIGVNDIGSEGFNLLWRALRDSQIEDLTCSRCGIHSIEIDTNHLPKNLRKLDLIHNNINADGCRELAKLLRGGNSTLFHLDLEHNKIDDEGIGILVNALQSNTSLKFIHLEDNQNITKEGLKLLLKLVFDISSIKATLGCNHTLMQIGVNDDGEDESSTLIQRQISIALEGSITARAKAIYSLRCDARAQFCRSLGVEQSNASFYSQFDPLHLPEVLALTGKYHGPGELYIALRWSLDALFATVNKEVYLKEQMDYHLGAIAYLKAGIDFHQSKYNELQAELAPIQGADSENRSAKRPRIE